MKHPTPRPARSYEEALERVRAFEALDDSSIRPEARTVLHDHGHRTPCSVVLLHGLTNHPGQYAAFAPSVHAAGCNVFIPRLPEQGDRNRLTARLAKLTAANLLDSATEALDISCGLGDRVCVLGISTSGLLCAYFGQYRSDVARAIPVSPVFGLLDLPHAASRCVAAGMRFLPNAFLWWDPRKKMAELPATGYPRFSTHALAQCMRIGDDVFSSARRESFAAKSIVMLTNRCDPAVNNDVSREVLHAWQRRGGPASAYEFTDLPKNHDIVDPQNAASRTDIVYPKLLECIAGTPA